MSEENVEIVRRAFDEFRRGFARGDPAAPFDSGLIAPEAEWMPSATVLGLRQVYRGREGFLEFVRTWTEDFDWSIELERVIDAGDNRVIVVFHQRGTGKGSGVPVELHMGLLYELPHNPDAEFPRPRRSPRSRGAAGVGGILGGR